MAFLPALAPAAAAGAAAVPATLAAAAPALTSGIAAGTAAATGGLSALTSSLAPAAAATGAAGAAGAGSTLASLAAPATAAASTAPTLAGTAAGGLSSIAPAAAALPEVAPVASLGGPASAFAGNPLTAAGTQVAAGGSWLPEGVTMATVSPTGGATPAALNSVSPIIGANGQAATILPTKALGPGAGILPPQTTATAPLSSIPGTTPTQFSGLSAFEGIQGPEALKALEAATPTQALSPSASAPYSGTAVSGETGAGALTSAAPEAGMVTDSFIGGTAADAGSGGLSGLLGGFDMQQMMLPLLALSQLGGGGGGDEEDEEEPGYDQKMYDSGEAVFPDDTAGSDGSDLGEWNYFPSARYYAEGGKVESGLGAVAPQDDNAIIDGAVAAIMGQSPNPDQALMMFVQTFGEEALKDLVAKVRAGGQQMGAGDGMSDSVPGMIDGTQPAALSQGEYVVPADVVSGLGNGSTDAGARQLEEMAGRVRQMRNGGPVQPPAINPRSAMPV